MEDIKEKLKNSEIEEENKPEFIEKVVRINRVAKVVKGGKRFGFSTLAVVGDGNGKIGVGLGKANDVRSSIEKAVSKAKETFITVPLVEGNTIPHTVIGRYGAGKIILKPAAQGTGVIAGGPARAVLTAVGVENILTKSLRTRNPLNVVYATINGLKQLRTKSEIAKLRNLQDEKL